MAGHDCKGCNFGLYRAIASIDGVERAVASFKEGYVTAWIDPATLKPETVTKAEVANKTHHKKLLWAVPIPGTKAKDTSSSKSK